MTTKASIEQALEQRLLSPHTNITSGQFRWGGVVTSNCARRSRFLGRVAVTHVQGPPKGGGALGALKVTTTRLRPVPPESMEEPVQNKAKPVISALVIAALSAGLWAAPSYAQSSYDDILNGSRQDSMNRKRADQEAGSGSPASGRLNGGTAIRFVRSPPITCGCDPALSFPALNSIAILEACFWHDSIAAITVFRLPLLSVLPVTLRYASGERLGSKSRQILVIAAL